MIRSIKQKPASENWMHKFQKFPFKCGVFQFYIPTLENYRPIYRVIHKSLRDFRTRLRNNQDRYGRKEHINR